MPRTVEENVNILINSYNSLFAGIKDLTKRMNSLEYLVGHMNSKKKEMLPMVTEHNCKCSRDSAVKIKKMGSEVKLPKYMTSGAAAFDFYLSEGVYIGPSETRVLGTGIKMEIPKGYEVQIRPRSGISKTRPGYVANSPGTIDSDYRGEVKIMVTNNSEDGWHLYEGDRIAQGVLVKVSRADFVEVEELSSTDRGGGGFGSTGDK